MKKKCIFPVAVAAFMLLPLLASAAGILNRISYMVNYDYSNLTVGTDTLGGVTYATVSYEGLYNGGAPGTPSLPIDYIRFSVPYNATNFTVTASGLRPTNQNLDYMVYPCQTPWLPDGSQTPSVTLPDTAAYYSGNSYPTQMAWIADEGFLAGENHIVTVAVMPLRYTHSASSDVLSGARICNLVLSYDLSDSLAMYPIVRNDSLLREEGYQLTQSMVVNPTQVKGFAPLTQVTTGIDSTGFIHGGIGGDVINGGEGGTPIEDTTNINIHYFNYPYLIVTTPELKHSVRRIAALKRQKGYNVKVVTMDEVLSSPFSGNGDVIGQGRFAHLTDSSDSGKLRQFLKNYFQIYGTKYVLLAGNGVPYHEIDFHHPSGRLIQSIPTDLYLSELHSDWTPPISSRKFDLNPELYVGRLLATDSQQLSNYCEKLFLYELNPGRGNTNYLKRIFYSEAIDMQKHGMTNSGVETVHFYYKNFFNDSTHYKESMVNQFPSGTDIISKLNERQYGYLSIMHHAGPSGFITYGHWNNSTDSDVCYYLWAIDSIHKIYDNYNYNLDPHTGNGLNNMRNKDYPNIAYSIGCTTMPYNVVPGYEDVSINIGQSFTMGKDYGGPAFLGNTRDGATEDYSSGLEARFAKIISNGKFEIGKAEAFSKLEYGSTKLYASLIHNLLGDPEFDVWTDLPERFSNICVERFDNQINISGITGDSIIIAYRNNQKLYKMKIATSHDVTLQDANPNSTIMLYKHNHIPYIAPLELQNETIKQSQYIIASDVIAGNSINDNRLPGNVIVKDAVEYEIEASGTVKLENGFLVEKGAKFAVYPSCF